MSEMPQSISQTHDSELGPSDVQSLSNADEITAFFARLGYNPDARTPQTPANLGITAEGTSRPIRKIELITDQEGLFQVYLFELTSVTVAHTRALARIFRNRAGNYLLVLTSDYARLDFVLLEKYLPTESADGSTLAPRHVGIRPRVLTVEASPTASTSGCSAVLPGPSQTLLSTRVLARCVEQHAYFQALHRFVRNLTKR